MKTINLVGGEVVFYDSPMQLPESLRTEHNHYALIEAGIGSDFEAVDDHFNNTIALLQGNDVESAITELNNLRYFFYNALHKEYSARSLALASLAYTVNGKEWTDYSEQGLKELIEQLSAMGLTGELVNQTLADVKKIHTELVDLFPERFSDNEADGILMAQKKLILDIELVLEPDKPGLTERVTELQKLLLSHLKPPLMQGENNDLDAIRSNYWDSLAAMQLEGINVTEKTTTVQFLKLIKAWNNKHKPKNNGPAK